ncbi:hypothetical protein [Heliophilum fasciatum]|uniref:Uncharacterized protein n=1 Tax=Heliophilum fasciatum TaxID=35700 RepID=A0A4R2RKL2_9FIRM|nr:hypothetical protein [Heliophilum fasciatum]MCW2278509.1 membrane protein implicated in regulation of membrane protease activity [Heliophilum fasciatum]TCP63464.1 hypothetical protein EDD73_1187 [Heliophilum fasciatum]
MQQSRAKKVVRRRRRKIANPFRLFLFFLLSLLCVVLIVLGIFLLYLYLQPTTYWQIHANAYYQGLVQVVLYLSAMLISLLLWQFFFEKVAKRPPLNSQGYWKIKTFFIVMAIAMIFEITMIAIHGYNTYYAYLDAGHPTYGEGRFVGREEDDLRLEMDGRVVSLRIPPQMELPTLHWQDRLAFDYGAKTQTLGRLELIPPELPPALAVPSFSPTRSAPPGPSGLPSIP